MKKLIFYIAIFLVAACDKQNEWLDAKDLKSRVSPETLRDYQALMDTHYEVHHKFLIDGLPGADDFYLSDADYNSSYEDIRNLYTWNEEIWENGISYTWNGVFPIVFRANAVLEGLKKIDANNSSKEQHDDINGQAYFYRAIVNYTLAQLYCKPYDQQSASNDLGLPLRNTSDVNKLFSRASLQETYTFMLEDAKKAAELLPIKNEHNRRPGRPAAHALLAKIYLAMEDYENALIAADNSLALHGTLLDFKSDYINMGVTYRFQASAYRHPEILFYADSPNYPFVQPSVTSKGFVNQDLYILYHNDDRRKTVFYTEVNNQAKLRGGYTGNNKAFCGIANNEVYLIKAESAARTNQPAVALDALNTLLKKRYVSNTFTDYQITDSEELLRTILTERRKELIGVANLRWEDLRRLNKDPRFAKTLKRTVNGQEYILEPNSNRYVLPIPQQEIEISGLIQNNR